MILQINIEISDSPNYHCQKKNPSETDRFEGLSPDLSQKRAFVARR